MFRTVVSRVVTFNLLLLLGVSASAQSIKAPDPLFRSTETLQATVSAPMKTLLRKRPTDEDLGGVFEYVDASGKTFSFDVKIRARGHSRHEMCDIPPLWLNFRKSQTKDTLLHKQDKLKLATQCSRSVRYEQSLLREFLAYRILNLMTPSSFQVRLLRLTYTDTAGELEEKVQYAFLLEHKNRLGKRINRKDLKIEKTSVAALDPGHLNLTSVFQFLIANTDFSPVSASPYNECCHNYVLFSDDVGLLIAVPYDFDQSGFVNAPYAAPGEQFKIRSVRQRVYRGRCANNDYLQDSLQQFRDSREQIYRLITDQEGLSSTVQKSLGRNVDGFYKIIDDPGKVEQRLIDECI